MRIIDKNTDFYDYLQDVYKDDTLTFDRTDSYVLTKEILCGYLYVKPTYSRITRGKEAKQYNFILLQICNTFWLFLVEITQLGEYGKPADYKMELVTTWKNYNKKRALIKIDVLSFWWGINAQLSHKTGFWREGYDRNKITNKTDALIRAVDTNDYRLENSIKGYTVYYGDNKGVEKHIPILKACGIANCVEALDVFLALEEYFSLEKSDSERTEAIGTTNLDKIENHGFDIKASFRGKR